MVESRPQVADSDSTPQRPANESNVDAAPSVPPWAEHTVVANLPRRLLEGSKHPAFAEAEDQRTVISAAPSAAAARELVARYAAAVAGPGLSLDVAHGASKPAPAHGSLVARLARHARDDFRRAPRIARLLLPALPLIAAATTFLDVDPRASAISRVGAASAPAQSAPSESALASSVATTRVSDAVPRQTVTIVRHLGRTLAAEAADAAARGDRAQAARLYDELAAEHPDQRSFADAACILRRDQERDRRSAPAAE